MEVTSIFSFSHDVFKSVIVLDTWEIFHFRVDKTWGCLDKGFCLSCDRIHSWIRYCIRQFPVDHISRL